MGEAVLKKEPNKIEKGKEIKPYNYGSTRHAKVFSITKEIDSKGNVVKKTRRLSKIIKNYKGK